MGSRRSLRLSTLVLTTLLLLLYGARDAHCSVVHGNTIDRRSLLDFKKAITDDPTGALRNWNDSIHHCMWSGVNCSTRHPGRVTALKLWDLNLRGQITPSIGNLTFLRGFALYSNRFSGQLPPLDRLRKLEFVGLGQNLLQGNIQDALIALANCSKLMLLDLSSNMLVGSIPQNIGYPSNLLYLYLDRNNLTGTIPPTFSNITRLSEISLGYNQLEGSIPEELGQFPDMAEVSLNGNRLSGRIPATLFNLSSLGKLLDLSKNMLSGTLPSDIGNTLPSLQYLSLSTNKFEGHISDSLGNASELVLLDLSSNYFTGEIPSGLGKLHKQVYLYLDNNKFEVRDSQSWEFLSALSNCPDLQILSLHGNQLHGLLPNSVGNLSSTLETLDLGANNFVGTIPHSIGNLAKLTNLYLSDNQFDGW